jgi:uncharacterized protein (TIGR00290 family)
MTQKEPVVIAWSGGKDSMLALHLIRETGELDVVAGLTTIAEEQDRVCMHGVRRSVLRRQAQALRLPLDEILLPLNPPNTVYEAGFAAALERWKVRGVRRIVFGDIFLADLKAYRDAFLASLGMSGIYPLWQMDSRSLVMKFLDLGYAAMLVCIDTRVLPGQFAGRALDRSLLAELPPEVDWCGENGEFHTLVWNGPQFSAPLDLETGEASLRDGFMYRDIALREPSIAPAGVV